MFPYMAKTDSTGVIKDLKVERLYWIFWVWPKCNHKCSYERKTEENLTLKRNKAI